MTRATSFRETLQKYIFPVQNVCLCEGEDWERGAYRLWRGDGRGGLWGLKGLKEYCATENIQ